jgi:hypothetical protein
MPTRSRTVLVAVGALVLGLAAGFAAGAIVIRNAVWGIAQPLVVSPGAQAHTVLVLLQSGQTDRLTTLMEDEIDHTLAYLHRLEPQPAAGATELLVLNRLTSYRAKHPRKPSAAPSEPQ